MAIEAVLFDYGNVVVLDNDAELCLFLAQTCSQDIDSVMHAVNEELRPFFTAQIEEGQFWANLARRLDYTGKASNFKGVFERIYTSRPHEGILSVIEDIKRQGIPVGVLSNIIAPLAKAKCDGGEYSVFTHRILSCEVKMKKPEEQIYLRALDTMGIPISGAGNVVFVDDKQEYLDAAQRVGFRTVRFNLRESEKPEEELRYKLKQAGIELP